MPGIAMLGQAGAAVLRLRAGNTNQKQCSNTEQRFNLAFL